MLLDATPKRYTEFNTHFNEVIDAAVQAKRDEATPRDYLGGSTLGNMCERSLGYQYTQTPKDEGRGFTGRVYRIFDRGHDGEARMAEYLKLAGFDLQDEKPGGGQWGFAVCRDPETGIYRLRGHADGIIMGGPDKVGSRNMKKKYPILWENKIISEKRYNALMGITSTGKTASKPGGARENEWEYYVQCQVYMAYLDLKYALFTAVSANTMHIYSELIELDLEVAQAASDRGVRVVTADRVEELPRIANTPEDWHCRWCDYKERCFGEKVVKTPNDEQFMSWGSW